MPTVHLVYPHADSIACPHAIALKLAQRLRPHYEVRHYDLTYARAITPAPGDMLLGHPDAAAWSVFRRSLAHPGWSRRIGMAPFQPGDLEQSAYLARIIPRCDLFLAITGERWFRTVGETPLAPYRAKLVHLDLAVDRADFPLVKTSWNPPGRRRFVYIGHDGAYKNLKYLQAIAQALPEVEFAWIGVDSSHYANLRCAGRHDFRRGESRELIAGFDFLITVGYADANPTTILEAMAWGLAPVCTPQSGYDREPGIVNVPLDDLAGATATIRRLQQMPEAELRALQQGNLRRLDEHYHWDRFASVVLGAIRSDASPALPPVPFAHRMHLLHAEMAAHSAWWRYHHLRRAVLRRCFAKTKPHPCGDPAHCAG